jgi:peptidoglycan hydrolase-like protein with peptidoglycan-binding domain
MPSCVKSGTLPKNKLADRFMEYDHAKVKGVMQKVPGLTRRRAAERALFIGGGQKQGRPILKIGSRGEDVKDLQKLLKNAGYDVGAIDGIFGKKTDAAVRMYQNDHIDACKTVDGIVGAKTWKTIENK